MSKQQEFRIIGCRRSGHHAIVFWIGKNINKNIVYINDIFPCKKPENKIELLCDSFALINTGRSIESIIKQPLEITIMRQAYIKYPQKNIKEMQIVSEFGEDLFKIDRDYLLLSFEDWNIEEIAEDQNLIQHNIWYGKSEETTNILVLRDLMQKETALCF